MSSNNTSRKRDRDDRVDFEYAGQQPTPINVTHVRFHSSVTEIYTDAFKKCYRLQELVFHEGLQMIGNRAFFDCTKLESIKLPSTLTEIGKFAFNNCSSLKEVVLNDGLKKIGVKAFEQCKSLQSITIPSSVIEIDSTAFAGCTNLQEVVLSKGLQTINSYAFYNCTSLVDITIPSTVTQIGDRAFQICNSLRKVELHEGIQKIERFAFGSCPLLEKFTFPNLSTRLDTITKTGHWSEVKGKIYEIQVLVETRGSEIFVSAANMRCGSNWNAIKREIDRMNKLATYYEKKEATSLFELALWKAKIDQTEANDINRDACRIEVPGTVKVAILQYLG